MTPTVAVVVPTFNRRRMLYAALVSVLRARPDEVVLIDDGTDAYDVEAFYRRYFILPAAEQGYPTLFRFLAAPPLTVDARMTTPRQGRLINEALRGVTAQISTLLCDDDLLASDWLDTLRAHWAEHPTAKLVRGRWLVFDDGEQPTLADPPSPMCQYRKMTAGNFAWASHLTTSGRAAWPEDQTNCLDDGFLRSLLAAGVNVFKTKEIGLAGWRREHPKANGNYSDGRNHLPAFRDVIAGGLHE